MKESDIKEIKKKKAEKENVGIESRKVNKKILEDESAQQGQEEVNSRTASKKRKIKRRKLTKK